MDSYRVERYKSRGLRDCLIALFVMCALAGIIPAPSALGQQAAIYYVYDELNRLTAVVDQQGNAGRYVYDATGNLTRVDRFDVAGIAGAVGITFIAPGTGLPGDPIQIFGKGFSALAPDAVVTINGVTAIVTAAAANRLVVIVPAGASTGAVVVSTPSGTGS